MLTSTSFQIISIEPTLPFTEVVNAAAERHCLSANFEASKTFHAPVCGIQYHVQEVNLSGTVDSQDAPGAIANCLQEIQTIAEQSLADGYLELFCD